ncbi:DUF1697 domain-containing protein [Streptomyces chumphonensis]|uniref:DUF1697 domain-containing protein n=1 Tax=Streptomyces chumphonensis TaxID=1214925 RepID=A0A927EZA5_9ACTN|nr:DUF1697 domain-containing protein [Streptomyces chumphonensis]MBD3931491.1 DUF1697 domain-containing protein [Streptomyces chumphonensis]
MTTRHIALLRGINVGGVRISMAQQRHLAEALGFTDVRVLLQTGNLVLSAPGDATPAQVAAALTARIEADHGAPVPVVTRTPSELAAELAANPYPEATDVPASLHCVFLSAPPEPAVRGALDTLGAEGAASPNSFRLLGRTLYLHCPDGIGRSRLAARAIRAVERGGVTATARNWNTATRLLALARS